MHPSTHHPIVAVIVMAMFLAGIMAPFLCAMDLSELNKRIGRALTDAVRELGWEHKQVYLAMGYSKGQWSKILTGEKGLSIARLHRAPFEFYVLVTQKLIGIKARDFSIEQREDAVIEQRSTHAA